MKDAATQMLSGMELIRNAVAEMRAAEMPDLMIASILCGEAGALWRQAFPNERERRMVVTHAAEVAITGQPQPLPPMPR